WLIPLTPSAEQLSIRRFMAVIDYQWHKDQTQGQKQDISFAAAFHQSWLATSEPHRPEGWGKLDEVCRKLQKHLLDEFPPDKVQLANQHLLAWKHATDAFVRVLKGEPKLNLKLPTEKQAPGLHLAYALAYHRLGNSEKAKECFDRVQLPEDAHKNT